MGDVAPPPAPSRAVRLGWYAAAFLVAGLLPLIGHRLDAADIRIPLLYEDDALLILPMVRETLDSGTHWRTERLGAWGVQEMHDFPVVDSFHFALIWLLGRVLTGAALVFNVYYLLTYPLAALTSMAVFRRLGLSFPAAGVGGALYAMQPYHLFRGENHYFLSAYYVVPLTLAVVFDLVRGKWAFYPASPPVATGGLAPARRFRVLDRYTLTVLAIAAVTSSAGAYYAFFGCAFLAAAGVYAWVADRDWRPAASAALVVGVIVAGGVLNHLPTFIYQHRYGPNTAVTERTSEEAEYYGLKLAQLILPIEGHSFRPLTNLKATYNSYDRPVQSITERYSFGAVAAAGLILLLVRSFLLLPRGWPWTPLAALTLFGVLLGTVGGLGAVFNHVVSPQVRCLNRIAIYLAVPCLFAALYALDGLIPKLARFGRWLPMAAWVAVCWFGVWDQTPYDWGGPTTVENVKAQQDRYRADADFFAAIEDVLNPARDGSPAVFQLPYVKWPESAPVNQLACYEHARGYLHTGTVRWSFGAMKNREVDEWTKRVGTYISPVTGQVVPVLLDRLVRAGFDGLLVDKRGYTPKVGEALVRELTHLLGSGTRQVVHADGQQRFFDLRPYRDAVRQGRNWEAECWAETHPVQVLWLSGFISFADPGYEWVHRWCGPTGVAVFVNPTDEPKVVTVLRMHIRTLTKDVATLRIRGDVWNEDLEIDKNSPAIGRTFVVPPGRHTVRFRCDMPASHVPNDPRRLSFFIAGMKVD